MSTMEMIRFGENFGSVLISIPEIAMVYQQIKISKFFDFENSNVHNSEMVAVTEKCIRY